MKILAIDCSGGVAGAAVVDGYKTIGECSLNAGMNHSITILPIISSLLENMNMTLSDVDCVACASGPGSFTGLRIGASAAKALAHGANKTMVPVPTLDALAYNVLDTGRLIVPIMDARRNQVYAGIYQWQGDDLVPLQGSMADDMEKILALVGATGKRAVFTGDGLNVHRERIIAAGHYLAPPHLNMQRAAAVGALAIKMAGNGQTVSYDEFELVYLRKPQAEREYERKQGS